jgi:hypothetical protein
MIEAARADIELRAACLIAFRDRTGDDLEWVGAILRADEQIDLALIRSAYQKK